MIPAWLFDHQRQLSQQIQHKNLPHALLISGVKGAGKNLLANWLVNTLLCQQVSIDEQQILQPCGQCKHCQLYHNGSYPDHVSVVSEKQNIGVDDIRQANQFLEKTAHLSGSKTVLIPNAQLMTESAANALLKTLEEPSAQSIIILMSSEPEQLLATVISRCRLIAIRPYVGELLSQSLSIQLQDSYSNLTHLPELTHEATAQEYHDFVDAFLQFICSETDRTYITTLLVNNDNGLRWLEKTLVNLQRQANNWQTSLLNQIEDENLLLSANVLLSCYKIFLQHQQQLINLVQANKQFVIEKMLIDMKKCLTADGVNNE